MGCHHAPSPPCGRKFLGSADGLLLLRECMGRLRGRSHRCRKLAGVAIVLARDLRRRMFTRTFRKERDMSCCGQNREALRRGRSSVTRDSSQTFTTRLIYQGDSSLLFRGPSTGRAYWFTPEQREQTVDPRDLAAIMATGLFQQG